MNSRQQNKKNAMSNFDIALQQQNKKKTLAAKTYPIIIAMLTINLKGEANIVSNI